MGNGGVVHAECSGRPRCRIVGGAACSQSYGSIALSESPVEVWFGSWIVTSLGYSTRT